MHAGYVEPFCQDPPPKYPASHVQVVSDIEMWPFWQVATEYRNMFEFALVKDTHILMWTFVCQAVVACRNIYYYSK